MISAKHPGATGVAPWIEWNLTEGQRQVLLEWFRGWKLGRIDEAPLLEDIERSVRLYLQMEALAQESSSKSVRRNLRKAVEASAKLLKRMGELDGNSLQIIRALTRGDTLRDRALEVHNTLVGAYAFAAERFPQSGRRAAHERDMLAALLADTLERHTSAKPTATRGKIFEELLREAFALVDEHYEDLHTLAERVTERQLVSRPSDGLLEIAPYESAPKRRR